MDSVVGAAYVVSNVLGARFLEKVYERALVRELALRGFQVESQVGFPVLYKGFASGTMWRIWWLAVVCWWS